MPRDVPVRGINQSRLVKILKSKVILLCEIAKKKYDFFGPAAILPGSKNMQKAVYTPNAILYFGLKEGVLQARQRTAVY